ncbi:MAG: hypothetical protein B7Z62_08865 [Deltaproteobacteria bacterium 37-65-8]|nr:MAG: hypothetical protein B7Z62_08865 [Deltaproteobacteria bacterium 37-65-8]
MFKTIAKTIPQDRDYPARQYRIAVLSSVLDGTFYDGLPHEFHEEKNDAGEYVPLRKRKPSVRYALCRSVVDDSVSMLFSEGHFPKIQCDSDQVIEGLQSIIKEAGINAAMIAAATTGSIGSACIFLRVLKGRVFVDVMNTQFLTPQWDPEAPDMLLGVTQKYKVKGQQLQDAGYVIPADQLGADFWFQKDWTDQNEIWYLPLLVTDAKDGKLPAKDTQRSVAHKLGFVPMVWVRNLPGGDTTDGTCTFPPEAIDCQIEIDYQLSQAGRGLRYSSDPTLMIKEPAAPDGTVMAKGGGNAIVVGEKGDAKMLEINGTAVSAVIDYVRAVRDMGLESAHGNRTNADKLSAAQSGRAMELMAQALIWLADKLRISYGEGALLDLLTMIVKASQKVPLVLKNGTKIGSLDDTKPLALRWPQWFAPTYADKQSQAGTLSTARGAGILSQETAIKSLAADYDIEDVQAEIAQIKADEPEPITPTPPSSTATPSSGAAD